MLRRSKTGFTLIELLVVIAIIAILAAILFPVFAKARDKARQAVCLSNIKQMALAIMMYKDDYDETYPPLYNIQPNEFPDGDAGLTNYSAPWYWPWQQLIYPYEKNYGISYCPNSPSPYAGYWVAAYQYGASMDVLGLSPDLGGAYVTVLDNGIKSDAEITAPADTYMIMDAGCYQVEWLYGCYLAFGRHYVPGVGKYATARNYANANGGIDPIAQTDFMNGRHNGGVNVGFADGHAKFLNVDVMYAGAKNRLNHTTPDPWGNGRSWGS